MKEALIRIKEAENENEKQRKLVEERIMEYEQEKKEELDQLLSTINLKNTNIINSLKNEKEENIQILKLKLERQAIEYESDSFTKFNSRKESIKNLIVERIVDSHGS